MNQVTPIGIDVGKNSFMLSIANNPNPRDYSVIRIEYSRKENGKTIIFPNWWEKLVEIVQAPAVIVIEPTGFNYLAPIVNILTQIHPHAEAIVILLANHHVAESARKLVISRAKTDPLDAKALAYVAKQCVEGVEMRGVHRFDVKRASMVFTLRLLCNEYRRLTKESTRLKNRLDAIGHGIAPIFAIKRDTWIRCVRHGYVTPDEIQKLISLPKSEKPDIHHKSLKNIEEMMEGVPAVTIHDITRQTALNMVKDLIPIEEQIYIIEERIIEIIESEYFADITELWRTIPYSTNIGIASILVACDGNPRDIDRDQFKACLGTAPLRSDSGKMTSTQKVKPGYRPAKDAIFMQASSLQSPPAPANRIREYAQLRPKENTGKACRRILATIYWGIAQTNTPYQYRGVTAPRFCAICNERDQFDRQGDSICFNCATAITKMDESVLAEQSAEYGDEAQIIIKRAKQRIANKKYRTKRGE